tara:strand:+ start:423 stop:608 length:186 start_codon:yes stop_codon:yes gene_type:complete
MKLSDKVKLILQTSDLRVVQVVKGFDKGTVLIQNQNQLFNGWDKIVRIRKQDFNNLIKLYK